jgi:ankyrin repeat protein
MGGDWKEMLTAAEKGDVALLRYHLRQGIDPNYQHPELLTTPLIESAMHGHFEVVKLLLENNAKPEIKSIFFGYTALEVAKIKKHKKVIALLEQAMGKDASTPKSPKKGFFHRFLDKIKSSKS